MDARVVAVSRNPVYGFTKPVVPRIRLLAGLGVEDDVHAGVTVRHRSRVRADPTRPNLRQVHLIHAELIAELRAAGFEVAPGIMGENVTTEGIELLGLSAGTTMRLGEDAIIEITGLRNPCAQLDAYQAGLTRAVLDRDAAGRLIRKAGVMAVVRSGGMVGAGDAIHVDPPAGPHRPLEPV
ncbi:MOSC domain-containing protein [Marinivivus vitaminiproducens]|uniref:MOSC domain-containing protein n=1 Tax=Marinivivus vitaminiproducens TaxID=3035935 RepID=UPI0027990356|nr:MOSC domain-containing protein [Geminicoccaceae bacterium SCSIO 64248]